ncbi:MAG: hypothetical protein JST86_16100 [Bacteroidetes bacterium]|nr:hypothetical protein [Bacteroidota bacterium]
MVFILKKGASKKEMRILENKLKAKSGVNVMKYCGSIKLKKDAIDIQVEMRNKWE